MDPHETARALLAEHHDDLDAALGHVEPTHHVRIERQVMTLDPATNQAQTWHLLYVVTFTDDKGGSASLRARSAEISAHEDAATARDRARETEITLLTHIVSR